MATTIQLKKSGTVSNTPANLAYGELAINYADGKLFYKDANGTIQQFTSGGGGGGGGNAFETVNANGTLIIADSNTGILTLVSGNGINITGNSLSDTVTLSVRLDNTTSCTATTMAATPAAVNAVHTIATGAYAKANAPLIVREVYAGNNVVVNTFANINTLQFDADSGMAVVDKSNNTVTIQLNSTFKYWNIDGVPGLEAAGLDTVNFIKGYGVDISANNSNTPKSIIFSVPQLANAFSTANSSYAQANAAYTAANTAQTTAQSAYGQANSAYGQANAAYGQANAAYTAANTAQTTAQNAYGQANSAYTAANTAQTTAQNAYGQANAAYSQANSAYAAANTAQTTAQNAYGQANSAYTQANAAYGQANAAYGQANSAYNAANTAQTTAQNAYGQANTAYSQANAAYVQANLAYTAANNSNLKLGGLVSGTLNVTQDLIVGGNIYLEGNTTFINVTSYNIEDSLIYLASNNYLSDSVDIGFIGGKNTAGQYSHTGLARNHTDGKWILFDGLPDESHQNNVITFANSYLATLKANIEANSITVGGNTLATQANLTIVYDQANAAYLQANAGYTAANTAQTTAQNAYGQANTAYDAANTAQTTAQNAYGQANAAYSQANSAYGQANLAYGQANAAYGQANLAYTAANSAAKTVTVSSNSGSSITKQLNFVNTATVSVAVTDSGDGNANIAFTSTGGGGGGGISSISVSQNSASRISANGLNFVNSGTVTIAVTSGIDGNANVQFTSVGGSAGFSNTVITKQTFTGNGVQTVFTLSSTPEDKAHTLVYVDSVYQRDSAYTLNGNQLEFASAPDSGSAVDVYVYGAGGGAAAITADIFTGTGSCTSFTLSQTGKTSRTFVYIDGVSQRPEYDFQVGGTTLAINTAPALNSVIEVRTFSRFSGTDINVAPVSMISDRFTGTGACTIFTMSQAGTTDSTFVFLNGVSQKPGLDYSVGNNTLTLSSPPSNGSVIEVRSVGNFKIIEPESKIESDVFTGTGACTVFTLSSFTATKKAFVYIDGVAQKPFTDYTAVGNKITFVEAPALNTSVEVRTFSPFTVADTAKTLIVYGRTAPVNIQLQLGSPSNLLVVGRSANTSVGVS